MEEAGMEDCDIVAAWSMLTDNGAKPTVGYSEFIAASVDPELLLSSKRLKIIFSLLDRDNDGLVTSEDLDIVLTETSRPLWEDLLNGRNTRNSPRGINFAKFQELVTAASRLT
jgi:hypothetical protein